MQFRGLVARDRVGMRMGRPTRGAPFVSTLVRSAQRIPSSDELRPELRLRPMLLDERSELEGEPDPEEPDMPDELEPDILDIPSSDDALPDALIPEEPDEPEARDERPSEAFMPESRVESRVESLDESLEESLDVCDACFVDELPTSSSFWLPRSVRLRSEPDSFWSDDGEPLADDVPP